MGSLCSGPEHLLDDVPIRVIIINDNNNNKHKTIKHVQVRAMQTEDYKIQNLCSDLIYKLQRIHKPCSYYLYSISFKSSKHKRSKKKKKRTNLLEDNHNHSIYRDNEIYLESDTQRFYEMLKQSLKHKQGFEIALSTMGDVEIPIHIQCTFNHKYNDKFRVSSNYNDKYHLIDLINHIIQKYINNNEYHNLHGIKYENNVSIDHMRSFSDYNNEINYPLTHWNIISIHTLGLTLYLDEIKLNCPYMEIESNAHKRIDIYSCPIYSKLMENENMGDFNEKNLKHLCDYNHFKTDKQSLLLRDKCDCQYNNHSNSSCKAFQRVINIQSHSYQHHESDSLIADRIHLILYRHRVRLNRFKNLNQSILQFLGNKHWKENNHYNPIYKPSIKDKQKYASNLAIFKKDGYLIPLKEEVINNGYMNDLYVNIDLIEEKLNCNMHKKLPLMYQLDSAEMFAIILYLNGECVYDMIIEQCINGNYSKWKWFDKCLYDAINKLSFGQYSSYPIYSFIDGKKYNKADKYFKRGYINSYISATKSKEIAMTSINDKYGGIMIEWKNKSFISKYNKCCNISWISLFPDEQEIIIQRSVSSSKSNKYGCHLKNNDKRELLQIINITEKK